MKNVLSLWISILLVLAQAAPAVAQEDDEERAFYRVEAIVFTHAGGDSDAWPSAEPSKYAKALDPAWKVFAQRRAIERAEADENADELQTALSVVETIASLESGETSLAEALLYPEPWLALDELSEPMAQARVRLEQNGAYRVNATLAWHQPLEGARDAREIRIHDDRVIGVDWITLSPTGHPLRDGQRALSAEALAPDLNYRLDGRVRLRQRQFMHADVTIDWRVPETIGPNLWPVRSAQARFETHRLRESRTIRPGRFEYFDSDWLGLLLRVTAFEPSARPQAPEGERRTDSPGGP